MGHLKRRGLTGAVACHLLVVRWELDGVWPECDGGGRWRDFGGCLGGSVGVGVKVLHFLFYFYFG